MSDSTPTPPPTLLGSAGSAKTKQLTSLQKAVARYHSAQCPALRDEEPALRSAAEKALAAWDAGYMTMDDFMEAIAPAMTDLRTALNNQPKTK